MVYRIRHPHDTKQVSVYLAHIKSYRPHQSAPAPDFHKLEELFLGKTLPTPALEEYETVPPHTWASIKLLMLLVTGVDKGDTVHIIISIVYGSKASAQKLTSNTELTRSQCRELIAAYLAQHQLETITPLPCNKQKHLALKDGNALGSDTAPKDGSPLESEPAIRKHKSRSGSNKEEIIRRGESE